MRDNILLTYIVANMLFVIGGGLLLVFGLVMEGMTSGTPTVATVARNLVLLQCPLKGLQFIVKWGCPCANKHRSCYRKCRSRLRYIPDVRPGDGDALFSWLVKI